MQIVVNHLTRMKHPAICVAGIDRASDQHIRPITKGGLTTDLLSGNGGPFGIAAVVDLGQVRPNPRSPRTEDHWFWPENARQIDSLNADQYWELLETVSEGTLEDCFGAALLRQGWTFAVDVNTGDRSLAVMQGPSDCRIGVNDYGRLTLQLPVGDKPAYIPVTDIRFYEEDQETVMTSTVEAVDRALASERPFLMLGLAGAYRAPQDDAKRHWLQMNGICLRSSPLALPG